MIRASIVMLVLIAFPDGLALAQDPAVAANPPPHQLILGDIASQIITWAIAVFGPIIASFVTALLFRMFKAAGVKETDLLKDQLQKIIVNGLNLGAKSAAAKLGGQGQVQIKSAAAQTAIEYVQDHGHDILKRLGVDPSSPEAIQAIRARIETALADPVQPTNPVIAPPAPKTDVAIIQTTAGGAK